jgi:hypothetical protein
MRIRNWDAYLKVGVVGAILFGMEGVELADASPTFYPKDSSSLKGVVNRSKSTVIADTEDPMLGFVLPPLSGEAKAQKFVAINANVGFCKEMINLQGWSNRVTESIANLEAKIVAMQPELELRQEALNAAKKNMSSLLVSNESLRSVDKLTDRVTEIELRLDRLYDLLPTCSVSQSCGPIEIEIRDLENEKKTHVKSIAELRRDLGQDYILYSRARSKVESAQDAFNDTYAGITKTQTLLVDLRETLQKAYVNFAKLEGGFATIDYNSGWNEALQQISTDNPSFAFRKIETKNATIYANFVGSADKETYLNSLPLLLDYSVNGTSFSPTAQDKALTLPAFPEKMSATLRLSLNGACPHLNPAAYGIETNAIGLPVFGISASYEFPTSSRTQVTFSYNLYRFYQKMVTSGSRGGFFSSKSWTTVTETDIGDETFKALWKESDPDNVRTPAEKREIEKEVKTELISRVLIDMATPSAAGTLVIPAAPGVPASGAAVLADGIAQTCGMVNVYCTGASWILRGMNAIFGSSKSEANYKLQVDKTAREVWDQETVRWRPGATVISKNE